jgi:hypothetical protein
MSNLMAMKQDPWETLQDPEASGMQKFLSILGSTKAGYQGGNGGGFSFQGPGADMNPYLRKLIASMSKGDRNPSKTTDAGASLLLNQASPVPSSPVNTDPLGMMPRMSGLDWRMGMGGM